MIVLTVLIVAALCFWIGSLGLKIAYLVGALLLLTLVSGPTPPDKTARDRAEMFAYATVVAGIALLIALYAGQ